MNDGFVAQTEPRGRKAFRAPELKGEDYTAVLERFHAVFNPQTYLEIGVDTGRTLALARCLSIGIDPAPRLDCLPLENKPGCCLYQMTSDRFFSSYNPSAIFNQPIDMAFIDGMHLYEFLLRDFINVERHSRKNSIIFLHDCLPADQHVGRRDERDATYQDESAYPDWWAGDVWKTLSILLSSRPDLRIHVFNALPTGLVAVTGLDPESTVLSNHYFELVESHRARNLEDHGAAFYERLTVLDTRNYLSFEALSNLFWL